MFEGRLIVSGGVSGMSLNTVEAYDHVADLWSYMPNMIEIRGCHKSVAIKNKLFVVGGFSSTCEVFDSTCNKFVLLKPISGDISKYLFHTAEVISIGNKLVAFSNEHKNILFYDVKNDVWSKSTHKLKRNITSFSCTKVPQIKFFLKQC